MFSYRKMNPRFLYLACFHDQNKMAFWRAGFNPGNLNNLKSFQKALID